MSKGKASEGERRGERIETKTERERERELSQRAVSKNWQR